VGPSVAISLMVSIAGIGLAVDAAEVVVARAMLAPGGLYSWGVLRLGRRYLVTSRLAPFLDWLFRYPHVLGLPVTQIGCAVVLVGSYPLGLPWVLIALAALVAAGARMLFYMRQQLGLDGADQMLNVVLVSAGAGALLLATSQPAGAEAAVDYAGLQLLLSYLIAGAAKAVSPVWRNGMAIVGITGTIGYGSAAVNALLTRRPGVARAACWSVIIFECGAVPVVLLGGGRGAWVVLWAGLAFHVGVAVVLGLNVFVWAFGAGLPALIVVGLGVQRIEERLGLTIIDVAVGMAAVVAMAHVIRTEARA
jgi:hypothetical protein